MPLKHLTETVLVVALAVVILLMGVLVRSTPAFPAGFVPLLLLFGMGLLYAAALAPMLRRNRADYPFRLLHLVPAAMPIAVLLLAMLSRSYPGAMPLYSVLTWGFLLPMVALALVLLGWFCFGVLRRRGPRIAILAALLALFVPFAVLSERGTWNDELTAMIWGVRVSSSGGMLAAKTAKSTSSQKSSILAKGETWNDRLQADLAGRKSSMPSRVIENAPPPHLPTAGPEAPFLLAGLAMYSGVLHARARKRAKYS